MQLGSSAIPLLPAVAVGAAVALVAVVLWGVHRARRNPPEVIPSVAPLRDATPPPVVEDWTGEAAAGGADPPAPPRRRTVADAVAARLADTQPLPVVDRPRPERPDAEVSGTDVRASDPESSGSVRASGPAARVTGPTAPGTVGAPADDTAATDGMSVTDETPVTDVPLPAADRPAGAATSPGAVRAEDGPVGASPTATPPRSGASSEPDESLSPVDGPAPNEAGRVSTGSPVEDGSPSLVAGPEPFDADQTGVGSAVVAGSSSVGEDSSPRLDGPEPAGTGPVDTGSPAGQWLPDRHPIAPSPVPPPWSEARSDPDATEPPVPDLDVADDPPHSVPVHGPAEPVSRAVRQALAARAVQQARRQGGAVDPAFSDPARSDPAFSDPARSDPAFSDPIRSGPTSFDPARSEATRSDATRPDPAGSDPARSDGTRSDPVRSDPARSDRTRPDPVRPDPVPADPALAGSTPTGTAAVGRAHAAPAPTGGSRSADTTERPAPDPRQTDARDRLLAVLLDDPARALGATVELDDTRARIDRIGSVLRRRRADLAAAVRRLHDSGLTGEQIERLSGLDGDDVRDLLDQPAERDAGEHR